MKTEYVLSLMERIDPICELCHFDNHCSGKTNCFFAEIETMLSKLADYEVAERQGRIVILYE